MSQFECECGMWNVELGKWNYFESGVRSWELYRGHVSDLMRWQLLAIRYFCGEGEGMDKRIYELIDG